MNVSFSRILNLDVDFSQLSPRISRRKLTRVSWHARGVARVTPAVTDFFEKRGVSSMSFQRNLRHGWNTASSKSDVKLLWINERHRAIAVERLPIPFSAEPIAASIVSFLYCVG